MRSKDMKIIYEYCKSVVLYFPSCSSTCEVVEEVDGEGEAGGLRVEHGRLRVT